MADEYDYLFKSIVVGDGGVGKTALTLRFSKGFFTEDYKMTIGVDFHVKTISIDTEEEGTIQVKLQIWDTGGQERFSSIRPMYYRGSLGALLIFDLTSYESFEHLPQWIEEVRSNIKNDIPFLCVGNKSDLEDLKAVSKDEINDFTKKFNLYYMDTSAKTGEGVGDCFYILACLMVGSGVPDQLISQGKIYRPGELFATPSSPAVSSKPKIRPVIIPKPVLNIEPEAEIEFSAPPVPEPEIEFSAPPVPEPEIEFSAPPVPEPEIEISAPPVFKSKNEVEVSDFEFKSPESILSEAVKEVKKSIRPEVSELSDSPVYKPKTIPFSSSFPIPASPPGEFQSTSTSSESLVDYMPETIISKKDKKKLDKQKKEEERLEKERLIQEEKDRIKQEKEQARLDKETKTQEEKDRIKQEKEQARLDKEQARLDKERKLQEKKDKAARLKEGMQKVKRDKKEKKEEVIIEPTIPVQVKPSTGAHSFFQTISSKGSNSTRSTPFVPFVAGEKSEKKEVSSLGIIPNVVDIDKSKKIPDFSSNLSSSSGSKKKELIICSLCGAMLSTDYAFCNKCGNKL